MLQNGFVDNNYYVLSMKTGQKFPVKSLEVSLQATVHFHDNPVPSVGDDPFCTGLNAYVDVSKSIT